MSLHKGLRAQHPGFVYRSYNWQVVEGKLKSEWLFLLEPDIEFRPTLSIPLPKSSQKNSEVLKQGSNDQKSATVDELVFHIGLVEMLSYWKTAASPVIKIKAGKLSQGQVEWWRELLIKGMGEYFYVNQIDFTNDEFVKFEVEEHEEKEAGEENRGNFKKLLVPLGGGKDSALTLELLNQAKQNQTLPLNQIFAAAINPTPAIKQIAQTSKVKLIEIDRQLDPQLLELNQQGYLNGHTPFNALAAFILTLVAYLYDLDAIVISNERSSNEGNVQYLGHSINHQYSKSFEFETNFRQYIDQLSSQPLPEYFSLLRPLYELQIAQRFASRGRDHFQTFRSCNRGQKTNSWCGECSKCLFAYVILFPFLGEQQMIEIFGQNLFENKSLISTAVELIGQTTTKPFECVGTYDESLAALFLSTQWYRHHGKSLPIVLSSLDSDYFAHPARLLKKPPTQLSLSALADSILTASNDQHHLPSEFAKLISSQR